MRRGEINRCLALSHSLEHIRQNPYLIFFCKWLLCDIKQSIELTRKKQTIYQVLSTYILYVGKIKFKTVLLTCAPLFLVMRVERAERSMRCAQEPLMMKLKKTPTTEITPYKSTYRLKGKSCRKNKHCLYSPPLLSNTDIVFQMPHTYYCPCVTLPL